MKTLVIAAIVMIVISYVAYTYYKKSTACDESLIKQTEDHKMKMAKIEAILKDANATIEKKEAELKKMGLTIKEANEMLSKKEEELKKVNAILTNANTTISTKETELQKLGLTIKEANEMIAKKEEELKKIQNILNDANIAISSKDQELAKIQGILRDANSTIATKEAELKKLGLTINDANAMIVKKDEELKKVNLILTNANMSISTKEEELKKLGLTIKDANEMIIKKDEELKKLGLTINDANAMIVKKEEEIKVLTDKMKQLTAEYDKTMNEKTELINKANSTITSLTDTLNQKIKELNVLTQTNQTNTDAISKLTNTIAELKQLIAKKDSDFADAISQKDRDLEKINNSLSAVNAQIKDKDAEIARLTNLRQTELKVIQEVLPRQQKEWNTIVDTILSGVSSRASFDGTWTSPDIPLQLTINGDNVRMDVDRRVITGKLSGNKVVMYDQLGGKASTTALSMQQNGQLQISSNGKDFLLNKGVKCNTIRISDNQRGYLNLAQIDVYDMNKNLIPIPAESISMAGNWDAYPTRNLVDRNIGTFAHNDGNMIRSITINLPSASIISAVVITNRQDCCKTRANGLMLSAQLNGQDVYKSAPVKDWSGSASYENGGTDNGNPLGYNYITFKLPELEPIISQHPIITPFDALDTTYSDAEMVCQQKGLRLCNSDELCSGRTPNTNLDIFGANDNWIAVGDRKDEWLTYNREGDRVCKTHTQVAGGTPGWSQNLDGNWKRAAKCCEHPKLDKIPDTKCKVENDQAPVGARMYVIRDNVLMGDDDLNRIIIVPLTSRNARIVGSNKVLVQIIKDQTIPLITDNKIKEDAKGAWAQFDFGVSKRLREYNVLNEVQPISMTDWTILGSNDGKSWSLIDKRKDIDMKSIQKFPIDSSKQGPYRFMRWVVEKTKDRNFIFAYRFNWYDENGAILTPSSTSYSDAQGDRDASSAPLLINGQPTFQRTLNYQNEVYNGSTVTTYSL